ncbi:uncharacterized protein LOC114516873 [Dendronephthya gigantea]|uniref:uncharacterized protein LOC114516873 n=1 Tax=Dendronephthya gigantea TaxID=151771 RepID=UPI00106CC712|nr:uncharacterized protein LOC114516873 [Dendronephthya gigantea]
MASNLLKEMGNKESMNLTECDTSSVHAESSEAKRVQERTIAGLPTKGPTQFSKSADGRKPVNDGQLQQQQMISHPSFNQEMAKDYLQSYANLQQPMFSTSGFANGGSAFPGSIIPPMLVQQPMQVPGNMPGMFQTGFMYQALPEQKTSFPKSYYFPPFTKGSLIMLPTGGLKPIEDLKTADFIESAKVSKQLSLETCKIAKIQDVPNSPITLIGFAVESYEKEVLVEKPSDHPFYVYDQGWASCKPDVTLAQYGLSCQLLKVGDLCLFLSDRIDNRSDRPTGLEIKTSVDDVAGRKQLNFGEQNKFLTSQSANGKEALIEGQTGSKTAPELGGKKSSSFENTDKSNEDTLGQPVGKKAKLDIMNSKTTQDALKN